MLRIGDLRQIAACVGVSAALFGAVAQAATRIDLDSRWLFRTDQQAIGEASGWTKAIPAGTQTVSLPHTWNIGEFHDFLGVGWYFRRFARPSSLPGTHVELNFGATFYKARIWLNGVELGAHEGGFTAYSFDISKPLRDSNVLIVEIDNRPGMSTIPGFGARGSPDAWYDWWPYGGIVRDVWLTLSGADWVNRQKIRSELNPDHALIRDRVFLQSARARGTVAALRVTAFDSQDREAASTTQPVKLSLGKSETTVSLIVRKPELWSIDRPNLYRIDAQLLDSGGKVLDENSDSVGLRTVEIRDRHLILNGEPVRLSGLTRHEDSPWEGLAETRGTMLQDLDDMKALHATLTRPVHYPQNPFILDYADRHGILLIPEIPVWQFSEAQLANPKVLALAQQQMREMIEQAGNHPSIFAWSVANESATGSPAGIAYFRSMRDFIRKLDPDRFVTYADDNLAKLEHAEQSAANDADFLMMNQYYGTWHGPASALTPALDKVNALFPNKMVIVSEFGYPGFFAKNPRDADQERIKTIEEQMPLMAQRDWIGGAIMWCYQDYKSRRNLWPGQLEGYVEHGVVDEARQRKPSYEVWKEFNAPGKLEIRWIGAANAVSGFSAAFTPNTPESLPYYPLHGYSLVWSLVDDKGRILSGGRRQYENLTQPVQVSESLSSDAGAHTPHLIVTVLSPAGMSAAQSSLPWPVQ